MTRCKMMEITPTKLVFDLQDEMNQVSVLAQSHEDFVSPLAIEFPNKINLPVLSKSLTVSMPGHWQHYMGHSYIKYPLLLVWN